MLEDAVLTLSNNDRFLRYVVLGDVLATVSVHYLDDVSESKVITQIAVPRYSDFPTMSIGELFDGNDIDHRLRGTFECVAVTETEYALVSMDAELDVES